MPPAIETRKSARLSHQSNPHTKRLVCILSAMMIASPSTAVNGCTSSASPKADAAQEKEVLKAKPSSGGSRPRSSNDVIGGGNNDNKNSSTSIASIGSTSDHQDRPVGATRMTAQANGGGGESSGGGMSKQHQHESAPSGGRAAAPIEPHAAARVIKGEIHNVLTVMRSSASYVSPNRFHEEFVDLHPLAHRLQDMHAQLAASCGGGDERLLQYEEDGSGSGGDRQATAKFLERLRAYIEPFCDAIRGRDISAAVTGAALSAVHKFLLYGFVSPAHGEVHASEIMTLIADSLVHCSFEEEDEAGNAAKSGSAAGGARQSLTSVGGRFTGAAQAAASLRQSQFFFMTAAEQEEQVVLKLLDLSALTVRCSLQQTSTTTTSLIQADLITGLVQTCMHVSHRAKRASPLLKSAAADALSQMVLQVFSSSGGPVHVARVVLLEQLAHLLKPSSSLQVTNTSLTLLNIALETCRERWQQAEVDVLQNDVCKYLLSTSTTHHLMILTLTLRVIFNLFDSLRNHLKVQLEVFLTSVHLRILEHHDDDEREVVLESLLEFCQEPALMEDVYMNYDCDVACTNLYELVVTALGKAALPAGSGGADDNDEEDAEGPPQTKLERSSSDDGMPNPNRNKLTDAGTGQQQSLSSYLEAANQKQAPSNQAAATADPDAPPPPLTHLNRLALEGLLAILDSIVQRNDMLAAKRKVDAAIQKKPPSSASDDDSRHLMAPPDSMSSQISQEELLERKMKKHALYRVAQAFNADPMGKEWMEVAVAEGQLKAGANAADVAHLCYSAPDLDKVELGIYLSKGPEKDYPFQAEVRKAFVALFDFKDHTFAAALRKFLSKFRLPGEAQCIDRLMEAFSVELYKQQGEASFFKNSDALYVLSFSTIMLNTDLHNPTIKSENRMTLKQFIRNNRGINGGEDLPEEFLNDLYSSIKKKQIQVRGEMSDLMMIPHGNVDFRTAWESILAKSGEMATPFFTTARDARRSNRAGSGVHVHDKEMFSVLAKWLLPCLTGVFLRSWDDGLVVKMVQGMKNMAKLAAYLDLDWVINDLLDALLPMGRDYIMGCVALDYGAANENETTSIVSNSRTEGDQSAETGVDEEDEDQTAFTESELPIPYAVLCSNSGAEGVNGEVYGSASHRGILALDCSFVLIRKYGARVTSAWPSFIECLCALRDARALPVGLADLDDFADSNGNVLPLSPYAKVSQRRLDEYYQSKADPDADKQKGWFRSFFRKSSTDKETVSMDEENNYVSPSRGELSTYSKALLGIAESADVEAVIEMGSTKLPAAEQTIQSLLNSVGQYPYDEDPVLVQHAIFSLELAARALLSNKARAAELFPMFLNQFESILSRVKEDNIPAPFVIERIVVTVLRSCIHLYEVPEVSIHRIQCAIFLYMITTLAR